MRLLAVGWGWPSLENSQRPFSIKGVRGGLGGICSHQGWGQGTAQLPMGSLAC